MLKGLLSWVGIIILFSFSFVWSQTWREVLAPTYPGGTVFYDGVMVSKNVGYIVGSGGIILKTVDGGLSWSVLNSRVTRTLYSVYFIDERRGFVGGTSRTLLRTTNGGDSWDSTSVTAIPDAAGVIYGIYFADTSNGWLVASTSARGWILRTTDGGRTWRVDTTISKQLYAMDFVRPGRGIVVGRDAGTIWYTKDGVTWRNAPAPDLSLFPYTRTDIRSVFMIDTNVAYAVGWGTFAAGLQPSIILRTTNGGETWTQVVQAEQNRTYDNLYYVWFKDSLNGIAVGGGVKGGVVVRTNDGGRTWVPLSSGIGATLYFVVGTGDTIIVGGSGGLVARSTDFGSSIRLVSRIPSATIYSVQAVNRRNIYASGYDGIFLRTVDGGSTWEASYVSVGTSAPNVNSIYFLNENVGYAACSYRLLAKTVDGGRTWRSLISDTLATTAHLYDVYFIDENRGFAVGQLATNNDVVYMTTDGGRTWTVRSNIKGNAWRAVRFSTPQRGVIVGTRLKALYTVNGGVTWDSSAFRGVPASLASQDLRSVVFLNDTVAVAVGNKIILRTTDGGASWSYVDSTTTLLYSVSFANDRIGYAVGSGMILRTADGGITWNNIFDASVIRTTSVYSVGADSLGHPWVGAIYSFIYTTASPVSVRSDESRLLRYELSQNYPNPFNPSTTIEFSIPEREYVSIRVFNLLGQEVATVIDNKLFEAGTHRVNFEPVGLPSGVYFYQMKAGKYVQVRKMIYIK